MTKTEHELEVVKFEVFQLCGAMERAVGQNMRQTYKDKLVKKLKKEKYLSELVRWESENITYRNEIH